MSIRDIYTGDIGVLMAADIDNIGKGVDYPNLVGRQVVVMQVVLAGALIAGQEIYN